MNTLVACLKGALNVPLFELIGHYTDRQPLLNPVGGWGEWAYDRQYPWQCFLDSRSGLPEFRQRCPLKTYLEVGFTVPPFLRDAHPSWKRIGLIQHPLLWIKESHENRYFTTPGDGTTFKPTTPLDYAKLWNLMTTNIVMNSQVVFRIEDAICNPAEFLGHLQADVDVSGHPTSVPLVVPPGNQDIWDCVEELALQVGYKRVGLGKSSRDPVTRNIIHDISPVTVIIAARNYGEFLGDAIRSALKQTMRPFEVIYSDDASTDDSLEIARGFPQVKVLTSSEHRGVCHARNEACKVARGKYLLHLDGDDILPFRYIEHRVKAMEDDPGAAFAYGGAQSFGNDFNYFWDTPEWDPARLWGGNFVNTTSLYRKDAFVKVGMWRETIGTGWDWDLAMRLAAAGYRGVRDPHGFLLYRHHAKSVSERQQLQDHTTENDIDKFKFLMRNLHCRTQISCVLSGRLLDLFPEWMEAVARNVGYFADKMAGESTYNEFGRVEANPPDLAILYTGSPEHRPFINAAIDRHAACFRHISLECERWVNEWETEGERRDNVARFMARSCNRLLETEAQLVWFLEDDVIPPDNAMYDLNKAILGSAIPLYASSGVYRNRHDPTHLVAHDWPDESCPCTVRNHKNMAGDTYVDIAGTGCLMVFRPYARHKFKSHIRDIPAHDWRWCMGLRKYKRSYHPSVRRVLLLHGVACRHYIDGANYVLP